MDRQTNFVHMDPVPEPFPKEIASPQPDDRSSVRMREHAREQTKMPAQAGQTVRRLHGSNEALPGTPPEAAATVDNSVTDHDVLCATNPATAGASGTHLEPHRRRLRAALVRELKPYQAADTAIFLDINGLPHPRWCNASMRALTIAMKRADALALGLFAAALNDPVRGSRALAGVLPSLWLTTAVIEVPVKRFFHRRRPFIDVVRATVVGRRPGSFSFPSGHSAAAFAGATLLRRYYPRWTPGFYLLAVAVGFSRIYLGAHYPSDVAIGGLGGTLVAEAWYAVLVKPVRGLAAVLYPFLRGLRWLVR